MGITLDFDGDAKTLVNTAWSQASDFQRPRNNAFKRDHKLFNGFIDQAYRDPTLANVFIPKIWQLVKTKVPRDVKALAGTRPYLPFDAVRKDEFTDIAKVWEDLIDDLLYKAGYKVQLAMAALLKTVYGTSFMDTLPYWEQVEQTVLEFTDFGPRPSVQKVWRLRVAVKAWAPWEVFVDPFATNLEAPGGCRYLIKAQLASKRDIIKLAQKGGYPGFDVEKLTNKITSGMAANDPKHIGYEMMTALGLSAPSWDSDIGVLLRYESEDRYVDVWNGAHVMRDMPNPFPHGRINAARWLHDSDAHTQNQFWGIGEVRPNEILQEMLNGLTNQALNSHEYMGQPVIYHDAVAISPSQLVRTPGNRVAVDRSSNPNAPIDHFVMEMAGQPLSSDHYRLIEMTEHRIDQTSNQYPGGRGEQGADKTAFETSVLQDNETSRHELNVSMGESQFLTTFGDLTLSIVSKAAMMDDVIEIVGQERAINAMVKPGQIPGGYSFQFKGSDKVLDQLIQQRNWKELAAMLSKLGNVRRDYLATKLLEVYGESDTEIKRAVIPDEIMMLLEQAQAEQEAQRQAQSSGQSGLQKQSGVAQGGKQIGQQGGKYNKNDSRQIAEETSRERTQGVA